MSSIPAGNRDAVDSALISAFGSTQLDAVEKIDGGLSGAALFRIDRDARSFVLRIEASRDSLRDPVRGYACMRIAATAEVAPIVHFADPDAGIVIMDFIQASEEVHDDSDRTSARLTRLVGAVSKLHSSPAFPELVNYLDGIAALVGQCRPTALLDPAATEAIFVAFADLRAIYRPRPEDLVSSHNDLNPGNVLDDGNRSWLIDWESAFLADRYVDLAGIANWFGVSSTGAFLRMYFGSAPNVEQVARFETMRFINHLFYGVMFLNGAAVEHSVSAPSDRSLTGPSLTELHRRKRIGTFDLRSRDDRIRYGKARLAEALAVAHSNVYADAVTVLQQTAADA